MKTLYSKYYKIFSHITLSLIELLVIQCIFVWVQPSREQRISYVWNRVKRVNLGQSTLLEGITLNWKLILEKISWSSSNMSAHVVATTTPSKISLHSNFGAYLIVMSSVALVIKCHFVLFHMFWVFLRVFTFIWISLYDFMVTTPFLL